ncbi:MAG TPA: LysE family translocator [Tepidisphaeraceae bacterium]|jgi:L-lysine exporter family protein LysE/ArgO|nr:LysE family translocator [Tepidisphaeraceae bacterium]
MFAAGLTLGLGAAAPIGPVNVEMARRTLLGGFRAGFALGCGAVTVDVTYALLSSVSLGQWVVHSAAKTPIALAGFLFLVYLGVQALRSAPGHLKSDPLSGGRPIGSAAGAYATGLFMTLLNPITLVFWFVELPTQGALTQDSRYDLPMICAGVFIGTLGWVIAFSGFLGFLGRRRRNWYLAAADGLGGVMLLTLAIVGLWHLFHTSL